MDYSPLFPQLFELQKLTSRKAELVLQMADHVTSMRKTEINAELSTHERDKHQMHFDLETHEELRSIQYGKMHALQEEYHGVCRQIVRITSDVEAAITASSF